MTDDEFNSQIQAGLSAIHRKMNEVEFMQAIELYRRQAIESYLASCGKLNAYKEHEKRGAELRQAITDLFVLADPSAIVAAAKLVEDNIVSFAKENFYWRELLRVAEMRNFGAIPLQIDVDPFDAEPSEKSL